MKSGKQTSKQSPAEPGAAQQLESDDAENARIAEIVASHWHDQIESKRLAIDDGDGDALLSALMDVVLSGAPFPEWLSFKVAAAIRRYSFHEVLTLDEAFGVKRPGGYRRGSTQQRWNNSWVVVHDILQLHRAGVPIDDALFEAVGARHGIGKTTASKWFYLHKNKNTVTYQCSCPENSPFPDELLPIKAFLMVGK